MLFDEGAFVKTYQMLFMKRILFLVLTTITAVGSNAQMTEGSVSTPSNGIVHFLYFTPPNYRSTGTGHPLIISLAGQGEEGDGSSADLQNLYVGGVPKKIHDGANMIFTYKNTTDGFVVIAPQLPKGGTWQNFYVDAVMDYAQTHFNIDPNRIFLTGYSLGAEGTWNFALNSPNVTKLAGIVPISGTGAGNLCNFATTRVAVWAFQGANDLVYGGSAQHALAFGINQCVNKTIPAIDTIYANYVHGFDFWDNNVYSIPNSFQTPNIYQWMLIVNRNINIATNAAPNPVIAGSSSLTVAPPFKIRDFPVLDGSGSTDDDIIVNYKWEQISGPQNLLVAADGHTTQIPALKVPPGNAVGIQSGTYVFRYRVQDYLTTLPGHTQFATFTFTVQTVAPGGHAAPATFAGDDVTLGASQTTQSEIGTWESLYPGSAPANFNWRFISGPQTASLIDFNSNAPYVPGGNAVKFGNMTAPGKYVFEFSVTNSAGDVGRDSITVTRLGAALPVTYAYLNGRNYGSRNVISWATTEELNSDRFEITRSSDGQQFSTVGSVLSRGGSSGQTNYSFEDINVPAGTSYYRLTQVDKDGKTHLSKVISLNRSRAGIFVDRFPNPARNTLTVTVQGESNGNLHVLVSDMQGRPVLQQQWQKTQQQINRSLNISSLQSGVYQLSVTSGSEKQVINFVKY